MPATITSATRVQSAISFINNLDVEDIYLFAGKVEPWDNEASPDITNPSEEEKKRIKAGNVFMKKAYSDSCILGIKRFNWTEGIIYTHWDDENDMSYIDDWESSTQPFYVFVQDESLGPLSYNVYMCIDNNNGAASLNIPIGQNTAIDTYLDGYRWKFMYNVDDDILNYLNQTFIPCPHNPVLKSSAHLAVEDNAIGGTIDRIKIIEPGAGYTIEQIHINITGDGSSASVTPVLNVSGGIEYLIIDNQGSNYSYADIDITGDGVDAELQAVISPPEGHGANNHLQLIASYVLHKGSFIDTEGGNFPTIGAYRRIGLSRDIKNPAGAPINGINYDLTSNIVLNNIIGSFLYAQRIIGNISGASAILFNIVGSTFYLTDKKGEFETGETIHLDTDVGVIATISQINNNTEVDVLSGDVVYYDNMQFTTRKSGQSETFIFSIEF